MMTVSRGEVVLVDYPYTDRAGSKVRPCIVVQNDADNLRLDDTIVVPMTSKTRFTPGCATELLIEARSSAGQKAGLIFDSAVQAQMETDKLPVQSPPPTPDQTPEEAIETAYRDVRSALADEVLDRVRSCSPQFFERLVVQLLVAMGYGGSLADAGKAVGRTSDDGIDGIIKEDRLGLDVVCIQAKRWTNTVGRPLVQAFAGSMEGQRAKKGVMLATSSFSKDAHEYVSRIERKIVLIDGRQLAELMIDHGIGTTTSRVYDIKRIDSDYFTEDGG